MLKNKMGSIAVFLILFFIFLAYFLYLPTIFSFSVEIN